MGAHGRAHFFAVALLLQAGRMAGTKRLTPLDGWTFSGYNADKCLVSSA
jgi:hypothetical protein